MRFFKSGQVRGGINLEVLSQFLFCGPPLDKANIHSAPFFILTKQIIK